MTDLSTIRLPLRIKRVTSGERQGGSFGIVDTVGHPCGYFHFGPDDDVTRRAANLLTEADAAELARVAARAITARIEGAPTTPDPSGSVTPVHKP